MMRTVTISNAYAERGQSSKSHALYVIDTTSSRGTPGEEAHVFTSKHRFKEFLSLHDDVGGLLGLGSFPSKRGQSSTDPVVMAARKLALEEYLNRALKASGRLQIEPPSALLNFLNVGNMKARREGLGRGEGGEEGGRANAEGGVPVSVMWKVPMALLLIVLNALRSLLSLADGVLLGVSQPLQATIEGKEAPTPAKPPRPDAKPPRPDAKPKAKKMPAPPPAAPAAAPAQATPASEELYAFMSPIVSAAGKMPLHVLPPQAVQSWRVAEGGAEPRVEIRLGGRYRRVVEDKIGRFEVTYDAAVTGKLTKEGLADIRGVAARKVGMSISANVTKMKLPAPGEPTVAFTAKPITRFPLPSVTLSLQLGAFETAERWLDGGTERVE